jgi:hypothetical protein
MAMNSRKLARSDSHRTYAEEVALMLSLVIIGVLGLAMASLLLLEFVNVLPTGVSMILTLSLLVFAVVLGRALFERVVAIPSLYRSMTPVVRHRH